MPTQDDVKPPDPAYVRQRWISAADVDWVKHCDEIMLKHGSVQSLALYDKRHKARWKAQRLMRLMVELRIHERWQLREHTEHKPEGWTWTVEYLGGRS